MLPASFQSLPLEARTLLIHCGVWFDCRPTVAGRVVHSEQYSHRYPYDWRTKKPVIFRATRQ